MNLTATNGSEELLNCSRNEGPSTRESDSMATDVSEDIMSRVVERLFGAAFVLV